MSLSQSLSESRTSNLANLAVGVVAVATCCLCLWTASHAPSPFLVAIAAIVFAVTNGTLFSLMHEAVHGPFSDVRAVNVWAGRLCAAFFPTSFALQRATHLTHHINNRSDAERFDYFGPDDNLGLKVAQWYSILTGLYWLMIPTFCIVYFFVADIFPLSRILTFNDNVARQTSAKAYAGSLDNVSASTFRLEVAMSVAIQAALFFALKGTWVGWALCYGAFALFWSSIQYADHAFSPLDRIDGAWDLKVNPLLRASQLNYFLHLVHHREPNLNWRSLTKIPSPAFGYRCDFDFGHNDLLVTRCGGDEPGQAALSVSPARSGRLRFARAAPARGCLADGGGGPCSNCAPAKPRRACRQGEGDVRSSRDTDGKEDAVRHEGSPAPSRRLRATHALKA